MDPLAGNVLVLSDLEHGNGKWRNISSIIRFTLRALLRAVEQQNARIQALEAASRTKASNADLERLAAIVPTTKYLDAEIAEVHRMLGSAVTHADLAAAVERDNSTRTAAVAHGGDLQRKVATIEAELQAHKRHLAEMRDDLHAKAPLDALTGYATLNDLDQKASIADVNEGLKHKANKTVVDKALSSKCDKAGLDALRVALGHKASKLEVVEFVEAKCRDLEARVRSSLQDITERLDTSNKDSSLATAADVQAAVQDKVDKADLKALTRKLVTVDDFEARLGATAADLQASLAKDFTREMQAVSRDSYRELVTTLNRKAYKSEVQRSLQNKVSRDEVMKLLADKADAAALAELGRKKVDRGEVKEALRAEGSGLGDGWRGKLVRLETAVASKADRAEVEAQLKLKADVGEVPKLALAALPPRSPPRARSPRASHKDRTGSDGGSSSDGVVPWDVQALNVIPSQLQWSPGAEFIAAVRPGLYEISLGFFCSEAIEVEILVNGDPIITAPGPQGAPVVHHVHPAGSIAGVTVTQFVTLPPRAEVAVRTSGEAPSQGFMNLRKL